MITIKTAEKAVTINDTITDNKGAFTYVVSGNNVAIRPKNYSQRYAADYWNFQCDGETFQSLDAFKAWLDANLFYKGGGSGEGLQKATSAEVTEGTNDAKYTTPKSVHDAIDVAMQGDMAAYVNVLDSNARTLGDSGFYTFNGTSTVTWTLPTVNNNAGVHYFIKNAGTVNLTISGNIYYTSTVASIDLAPGDAIIIHNNTSNWTIQ